MQVLRLVDERGRVLQLGEKLGEGGEGAVYRLATNRSLAAKVYKATLTADRVAKIRLLAAKSGSGVELFTAWPAGLVLDDRRQPRGLLLPVVEGGRDIYNLYNPAGRRTHFPDADWRFLVHVATNLARAFAAVHELGLVIGDVNHASVLVARDGTVRLIDVDSFQVPVPNRQPLLCTVAAQLFHPPELAGADLGSVIRSPRHDAFGLAVLIFHLLLQGRHPYAGRYMGQEDMPIDRAIREHRFAYSRYAASRHMQPPPNSVGLEILPRAVASLFEAAFSPDPDQPGRPTARQWIVSLQDLASELAKCPRVARHYYPRALPLCPWCPLEQQTGVFLFGVTAPSTVATATLDSEYERLIGLIGTVPVPTPVQIAVPVGPVSPSSAASSAQGTTVPVVIGWGVGPITSIVGLGLGPAGVAIVVVGLILVLLGTTSAHRRRAPWRKAYREARRALDGAREQATRANGFPNYNKAREQVTALKADWATIPGERARMYQELERNKRNEQLQVHLSRCLIQSASISGIGPGLKSMLTAYGIDTAADVTYGRVSQVPQFGQARTEKLMAWRRSAEGRFRFDASKPLPKEAVARVEKEIDARRRRCVDQLRQASRALLDGSTRDLQAARAAAQEYSAAARRLRQAEADAIQVLGKVPK